MAPTKPGPHPEPEPAYHTLEQFRCIYHPQERAVTCEPFLRTFLQSHPPYGPMTEVTGLVGHGARGNPDAKVKSAPVGQKWVPSGQAWSHPS